MPRCSSVLCIFIAVLVSCVLSNDIYLSDNAVNALGHQDTTSQLLGQLVSVLDRLASLDQRFDNFDQRLNALDQSVNSRVNELKDRVDTLLSHSSSRVNTVMQDLRAVCAELPEVSSSSSTDVNPPSTTKEPEVPFRITSVRKRETEDFYKVRVAYEGTTKPTVLLRLHYDMPNLPLEDQGELGMVELDIPKSPDRDRPYLYFMLSETYTTLHLSLNNTPSSMDVPRIAFEVLQGNEIKFKPGQKVKVDFKFDVEGDVENIYREDATITIFMQSDTEDNVIDRYNSFFRHDDYEAPVRIDIEDMKGSKGHRYGKAIINGTKVDAEGLVEVSYGVHFNCSRNCLVDELYDTFLLKFYREDHEAPFPKDFIGFIRDDFKGGSGNQFACDVDDGNCLMHCEVMGDHLTDVEITRVMFEDEDLPLDNVSIMYGTWGFSQLFMQNVSFDDAGDYQCTARSQSREITEQLILQVIRKARIVSEKSHINKFKNGSLLATCVAEGIPTPNVTFENIDAIDEDDYSIDVTHPVESQTRTDLFISDPTLASNYYGFGCMATNVEMGTAFYHGFDDYAYLDDYPV